MASVASASSTPTLLFGIHSWNNADARRKRRVIRELCPLSDAVVLRFIAMSASGGGSGRGASGRRLAASKPPPEDERDILRFDIGAAGKTKLLQKYLLANAFLRHAAAESRYDFVGRSEDDALVDPAALATHLRSLVPRDSGRLLYGVRGEWVMWSQQLMTPVCWAQTLRRYDLQRARDEAAVARNASSEPTGECRREYLGPSLLVKGPLIVYSRRLLRELVAFPAFAADEAHVRAEWKRVLRTRLETEHKLRPGAERMGVVYAPFAEDVYYANLIHQAMRDKPLTFVTVPMAEYAWQTPPSKYHLLRKLPPAAVYHRLSSAQHVNASGFYVNRTDNPLGRWWRKRRQKAASALLVPKCRPLPLVCKRKPEAMHCCRSWELCTV